MSTGQFARTVSIDNTKLELAPTLLAALRGSVGSLCVDRFPRRRHYALRTEIDRGVVEAERFVVERRGFVGVVTVQWYAKGHSYRHAREAGIAVRIAGQAQLRPTWSDPGLPAVHVHTPIRVATLAALSLVAVLAGRGVLAILQHPSTFPALDLVGFVVALTAMGCAVLFAARIVRGRWFEPRARKLVAPRIDDHLADLQRWQLLGGDIGTLDPALLEPEFERPQPAAR